jgi:hypothetical protein
MKKLFAAAILATTTLANFYPSNAKPWPTETPVVKVSKSSAVANEITTIMPQTSIVAVIDLTKVNTFIRRFITDPKTLSEFDKSQTKVAEYGFNLQDARQIAIGANYEKNKKLENFYVLLDGDFDREKILSTLAEKSKQPLISRTEEYQNRTLYFLNLSPDTANNNLPITGEIAVAFLSQQLVAIGTSNQIKQVIDVQSGRRASVLSNPEIANYLSRINAQAALRFVANLTPETTTTAKPIETAPGNGKSRAFTNEDVESTPNKPATKNQPAPNVGHLGAFGQLADGQLADNIQTLYGTIDLDLRLSSLEANLNLVVKNDANIKELSDSLKGLAALGKVFLGPQAAKDPQIAKMVEILNLLKVNEVGKEIRVNLTLNKSLINELLNIVNKTTKKK